jgi:TonB family protein
MKRWIVTLCVLVSALCFGAAKADAMAEFCPATVASVESTGGADVPSAEYSYVLDAKTARTVADAAIVADTDHGWYRWRVANLPLQMTSQAGTHRGPAGMVNYTSKFARSERQLVVFPEVLSVRHAWITSARSDDESVLGWGKVGEFACEVPAFPNRGVGTAELARSQSHKATPSPAPAGPALAAPADGAVRAIATSLPFDSIDCVTPFRDVRVTGAVSPDYPSILRGNAPGRNSVILDVASDEQGHVLDVSVFAGSGFAQFDAAAMRAARQSSYSGAVSYCQQVKGEYLFTATFDAQ